MSMLAALTSALSGDCPSCFGSTGEGGSCRISVFCNNSRLHSSFVSGSGSREMHGMEHFMERNVVMVSFNYRLGVLGGLYLDREVVTGNQGMWDQVMALTWVRDNIKHFGGDHNRVTIFGESAGAMSVVNLVLTPVCKGQFSSLS